MLVMVVAEVDSDSDEDIPRRHTTSSRFAGVVRICDKVEAKVNQKLFRGLKQQQQDDNRKDLSTSSPASLLASFLLYV